MQYPMFDVFLAHNTEDKPQVRKIAQELKLRNLKPWLDEEQIRPGQIFQVEIQKAIQNSKTAVIFIGKKGLGRWQEKELPALYGQFVQAKNITIVIPVLLPGVDKIPQDLLFLAQHHWVSFTNGIADEHALSLLEHGIRGESPEHPPVRVPKVIQLLNRKQFLQWVGWGSLGLVTTSVVGGGIWSQRGDQPVVTKNEPTKTEASQTTTPETKPTNSISPREQQGKRNPLESEKGIDYTTLDDLLKAQNWKEADQETYQVMIQAVGKKAGDWFTPDELLNFPCTDLRTIDRLWEKYSNGHFGLSVQKKIYLDFNGKADGTYYKEAWLKFGDRVGWRVESSWIDYSLVTFDTSSPTGHLPYFWFGGGVLGFVGSFETTLFSRIETCK
ncbi:MULTISPECIES: GUN4 domain-containing protein [unclassified Anabaena]|uniref:GUN4 domain-containing protein n=1 Tax=unclassified Anabaena TaxID=2619674 RepID=UPI0039C7003E